MSKIRLILFPLAVIYDGVTRLKNFLYDQSVLNSNQFNIPIIIIGNLSVGGTGKTPHTEFLANFTKSIKRTAVLSRGYGRKTTGYQLASSSSTAEEVGDEPLQIFHNIDDIHVAVCEDRVTGVTRLINDHLANTIILDDAFQHRKITGSLYILLSTYKQPYYKDYVLPAGNLRETAANKKRADIIIITKCPLSLTKEQATNIIRRIKPSDSQKVFFTTIQYQKPQAICLDMNWDTTENVLLVTGIVNPKPLEEHLLNHKKKVKTISYSDHYNYGKEDIQKMQVELKKLGNNSAIVITSKDKVKIKPLLDQMNIELPVFEIPIKISFLFNEEDQFKKLIHAHVI